MRKYNSNEKCNTKDIKQIFMKPIVDIVNLSIESNRDIEPTLKVIIPNDFIDEVKNGNLNFMKNKRGEILPNIVDSNNKIVKQIRLTEIEDKLDSQAFEKFGEYSLHQQLDKIDDKLENITYLLEDIFMLIKNNHYGLVDGSIATIKQSLYEIKNNDRRDLQNQAQHDLNISMQSLSKDIKEGIDYFNDWRKIGFIQKNIMSGKYSKTNRDRKFNALCKDYYYFRKSKKALIELKVSQGISYKDANFMLEDLNYIDKELRDINIVGWLPVKNEKNKWQHDLLNNLINTDKKPLVLEFNTKDIINIEVK
ncbi:hypothetical protein [Paraclostridium bifermentans]|uniref:hypothetical protein n=1 Tax=Paraclostridium bifermentans TaxID=1490 RepID=UPI001FF3C83E|nr:hypothetical protein [Paraclostridium bifermentans]UOW69763.1 hypothetical protein MTR78_17750 [Paraclostridium bifermentans]